ncbi:MAG: ornithine carbamoyltransferase [Symbiobacteriaceae bacterium]|jgi:ornithine carbamoyltransferase|nr:ornithine carbamoyltransferase [Symbiobacteriaceae bacterium]
MTVSLKGRDFLDVWDFNREELDQILNTADMLKLRHKMGIIDQPLKGKTLGMYFSKASTRTRLSFEVGIYQLGGYGLFLSANDLQLRRGESIADTARVFSRYLDGIMIRTFSHQDVLDLAQYADIPVINALTDYSHPCQIMADVMTIREKKRHLDGLKMVFVGDGNNVALSIMEAGAKFNMEVVIACPKGYEPKDADLTRTGARVVYDPVEAVTGADVIYTDVWASMGQEAEAAVRKQHFAPYQVNADLVKHAKPDYLFMHCLPAHRGEEVTNEVADSINSVIFDEAENRLHAQKAIMALIMG